MQLTEARKLDHLRLCLEEDVETGDPLFNDIHLVHQALPEADADRIDTSVVFLRKKLSFPLVMAAMTGGCQEAKNINYRLASIAEEHGLAFGVGSQRAMIEQPSLTETYAVRESAPMALLFGNIGITALQRYSPKQIDDAMQAIGADAVCVHINPAQELFQEEGERNFTGCCSALRKFCKSTDLPVIAKEVGSGISRECAVKLQGAGVAAIDVGGAGGTNWILIDSMRSGVDCSQFRDWGIPTAVSIRESLIGLPLIATGGVRNGLDMAKAIALGANLCGIALPFLRILDREGRDGVKRYVDKLKTEFIRAMYLTGCKTVSDLKRTRYRKVGVFSTCDRGGRSAC